MKKWNALIFVLLIVSVLFTPTAFGSMFGVVPSKEFLAENADIIVTCRVVSVSVESHRTVYGFEALEAVKGSIDKEFRITKKEGIYSFVTPTPVRFDVGQEFLLFLVEGNNGYYVLFDYWGKQQLSLVDEVYLDSLRADYFGSVNNPQQYLMITEGYIVVNYHSDYLLDEAENHTIVVIVDNSIRLYDN